MEDCIWPRDYEELGIQASKARSAKSPDADIQYERISCECLGTTKVAFVYMYTKPVDAAKL